MSMGAKKFLPAVFVSLRGFSSSSFSASGCRQFALPASRIRLNSRLLAAPPDPKTLGSGREGCKDAKPQQLSRANGQSRPDAQPPPPARSRRSIPSAI